MTDDKECWYGVSNRGEAKTDLEKYNEEQATYKLLAYDIMTKSRDLAWAKVRKLEWELEQTNKELELEKERKECLRIYYQNEIDGLVKEINDGQTK